MLLAGGFLEIPEFALPRDRAGSRALPAA